MSGPRAKVLLAMSGGVDSSVAAALLLREGYDVVGCFMRLGTVGESLEPGDAACDTKIRHRGCCSVSDAADARLVAAQLGIPFYVCNFKEDFGRIIDYFVEEYAGGRTPNPCVRCNDWLKFGKLHDYATELGCDYVASGHYARIVQDESGHPRLARGLDEGKDQSYYLFGVGREKLSHMLLPIGELRKTRVRELAEEFGLPVFDKPDSQEICFVPDDDYAGLVERRRPELAESGEIVDASGRVVGEHGGQHRFTIGQRRKIGVALGHPIYVVDRDPASNRVTVGEREDLVSGSCDVGEANWHVDPGQTMATVSVRYRSTGGLVGAAVSTLPEARGSTPSGRTGRFQVRFRAAQEAVAPGQALVAYDDRGRVLGGGWIERARRADA